MKQVLLIVVLVFIQTSIVFTQGSSSFYKNDIYIGLGLGHYNHNDSIRLTGINIELGNGFFLAVPEIKLANGISLIAYDDGVYDLFKDIDATLYIMGRITALTSLGYWQNEVLDVDLNSFVIGAGVNWVVYKNVTLYSGAGVGYSETRVENGLFDSNWNAVGAANLRSNSLSLELGVRYKIRRVSVNLGVMTGREFNGIMNDNVVSNIPQTNYNSINVSVVYRMFKSRYEP